MVNQVQPLGKQFAIADDKGNPTDYFIRWAQQRQIDIQNGVTPAQVQALIDAWAVDRDVNAGTGLSGGGNLSNDITLSLNASLDQLNDVDLTTTPPVDNDVLTYDAISGLWIPGVGGGGGSSITIYFGHGAPVTLHNHGDFYFDIDTTPYTLYVQWDGSVGSVGGGGASGQHWERNPTIPHAVNFTWVNQGGATATDVPDNNSVFLSGPLGAGDNVRSIVVTAPAAPFTITIRMDCLSRTDFVTMGIVLRNSGNSRLLVLGPTTNGSVSMGITRYTNNTTFSATTINGPAYYVPKWLRASVTTTTVTFQFSEDGNSWQTLGTETRASFITTINQIGVAVNAPNTIANLVLTSFEVV